MPTALRVTPCIGLVPALLLAVGCSSDGCPCEYFTQDELVFEQQFAAGSIAWNGDRPLVGEDVPPEDACRALLYLPKRSCGLGDDRPEVRLEVSVVCTRKGDSTGLLVELGDIRELPIGQYSREASTWGGISHLTQDALFDVLGSTGAGDEYPDVVTADFSKSLRVQFVTGTFDATLAFELTAQDFDAKPRQECKRCRC